MMTMVRRGQLLVLFLFLTVLVVGTESSSSSSSSLRHQHHQHHNINNNIGQEERWQEALRLLHSFNLQPCAVTGLDTASSLYLPLCPTTTENDEESSSSSSSAQPPQKSYPRHRFLQESAAEEKDFVSEPPKELLINFIGATVCVCIAALAAGLTLGMLGMDPLLLLIKERASDSATERAQAKQLLPLVKQHHRLLVTLLLMNSIANEALPIFLEALVPPSVAILVSVTLVLFFGEIIPSAIFTGPNQLAIASALVPVVRLALFLLAPLAWPIAKLLDCVLHTAGEDGDDHGSSVYKRGELSALIRIQYEERLASKRKRKQERQQHRHSHQPLLGDDTMGSLDFSEPPLASQEKYQSVKALKSQLQHTGSIHPSERTTNTGDNSTRHYEGGPGNLQRSDSLHVDEVIMIEGALQMKTKVALDVYTPLRRLFAVPETLKLSEKAMVQIYASGFSRVPVYRPNPAKPKDKTAIIGILLTKQLILLNASDARPISSMPLYTPSCVSPQTPLYELVNLFQTGGRALKGGHLALVCARPREGNIALAAGDALPERAGFMGVITLEDVLESLLQEQIYDENDRYERDAARLAKHVVGHWKRYVKHKKEGNPMVNPNDQSMADVVEDAMHAHEATLLLGDG
eukprot:scaffold43368_cov214-Amphora_coffeaeformis.AAC.3